MGSKDEDVEFTTVLVTGFEAFQAQYPINPSYEIAKALPPVIKASGASSRPIRVILHDPAVRVVYDHVYELVPRLLAAYGDTIDMVLHIGMASNRQYYAMEKYAHRDGYAKHKDLEGRTVDEDFTSENFADCPAKMTSSFDCSRLWEDWWTYAAARQDPATPLTRDELRQSEDAGTYLCDFIYLNSLAYYGRLNKSMVSGKATDRPVIFYHVPGASDPEAIARGTAAATALIEAMADQIADCA